MTFKAYVWGMRFLFFLSTAAFILVLVYINPESSAASGLILFYSTLFLFLASFFNLFLLFSRKKLMGTNMAQLATGLSFRQGILLALLSVSLLILQGLRMLVWWDGMLVVAGIFLLELYFLSRN